MQNRLLSEYQHRIKSIPAPGCGCHTTIMGVSNLGVMAGLGPEQIFVDIRDAIPKGKRRISDREIQDAIRKALADYNGGTYAPRPRPAPVDKDGKKALQKIISQGKISDEVDLWEASPIRLWEEP